MDERRRRDGISESRHVRFTCGWSSDALARQREDTRMRDMGGDIALSRSAWIGQRGKRENAVQTLPEDMVSKYIGELTKPGLVDCSIDGLLHQGDVVQLVWSGGPHPLLLSALPTRVGDGPLYGLPCRATGTPHTGTLLRTSIRVLRNDYRIPSSVPLMFDECLCLCTLEETGSMVLHSEPRTPHSYAPLSEHQEVTWASSSSSGSLWKALPLEGADRPSHYIQVNEDLVLNHVITNQNLALECQHKINTVFGMECEVTAHTGASNNGRTAGHENMWRFQVPYHESVMPPYRSEKSPPAKCWNLHVTNHHF